MTQWQMDVNNGERVGDDDGLAGNNDEFELKRWKLRKNAGVRGSGEQGRFWSDGVLEYWRDGVLE
ncbi:MAG: hypothetical protein HYZ34_00040 [Ignavibacteriae bacterium]|nr:hypothetical protein [Ignavibacteriota bacterium]